MTPLHYRQSGEYDADSEITVDADGQFTVEHGGYVTAGRRHGTASWRQRRTLDRLASAVDPPQVYESEGAVVSTLQIGSRTIAWAGAPPTPALADVVNALVRL